MRMSHPEPTTESDLSSHLLREEMADIWPVLSKGKDLFKVTVLYLALGDSGEASSERPCEDPAAVHTAHKCRRKASTSRPSEPH